MSPDRLPERVLPADRPEAPPAAEVAGQILFRQLHSTVRGKRFWVAAAIALLAPLLALLVRDPHPEILERWIVMLLLPFLLPLVAVSLGSGLLYDEAEEGTLTFLFSTPASKSAVVLGKWAAALATGWAVGFVSLGLTFLVTATPLDDLGPFVRACWLAVLLGYPAYLGIFVLLGTLFRRGFIAGLIYAFGYEMVVPWIPGVAKRLSLGYYLRSLLEPHAPAKEPFGGAFLLLPPDPEAVCIIVLVSVALLGLAVTLAVVPRKEFQTRNVQG